MSRKIIIMFCIFLFIATVSKNAFATDVTILNTNIEIFQGNSKTYTMGQIDSSATSIISVSEYDSNIITAEKVNDGIKVKGNSSGTTSLTVNYYKKQTTMMMGQVNINNVVASKTYTIKVLSQQNVDTMGNQADVYDGDLERWENYYLEKDLDDLIEKGIAGNIMSYLKSLIYNMSLEYGIEERKKFDSR